MYAALSVLVEPSAEPVSVTLLRQHARIDFPDDDNLLQMYITAARSLAENYLGRALVQQQLRYSISQAPPSGQQWPLIATPVILPQWLLAPYPFQRPIKLPLFPVQSIDRVAVSHQDVLTDTVVDPSCYSSDLTAAPARLLLTPGAQPQIGQHVLIDFTAGYAGTEDAEAIPPVITLAIMFGATWFYEHRGDEIGDLPPSFYSLLTPNRLVGFG